MGINKEKLLEKFLKLGYSGQIPMVISEFPEEPEIDFDALWNEYEQKYSCKKTTSCDNCTYPNKLYYTTSCFVDFLKSKHLSAPVKRELPVKTTWKLKDIQKQFCKDFGFEVLETSNSEPDDNCKQYYDKITEPDCSKLTDGDIVEVGMNGCRVYRRVHSVDANGHVNIYYDTQDDKRVECTFKVPAGSIIRVVEWGDE